jgi:hypothetical protein
LYAFIEKQETINTQLAQSITDFKDTLVKFTSTLSFQEKCKFPSQPQQNLSKVIEKPILEPCDKDDESIFKMHLLMFPLLEEILRKLCMHSLKSKRQSTLNLLKA